MSDPAVASSVTRDMERVFAPIRGLVRPPPVPPPPAPAPSRRLPVGPGRSAWVVAAVAVAALIAGLTLLWPRPAPQPRPVAPEIVAEQGASPPPIAPPAVQQPRAIAPNPIHQATPPATEPRPAGETRRAVAERATPARPTRQRERRTDRPAATATAAALPADRMTVCRGRSDRAACLYAEVARADGRVRRAYASAVATGAPVADIRSARRSWRRALSRSKKEPLVSIGALDGLAATLDELPRQRPRS